jgi:hypothetical protein
LYSACREALPRIRPVGAHFTMILGSGAGLLSCAKQPHVIKSTLRKSGNFIVVATKREK